MASASAELEPFDTIRGERGNLLVPNNIFTLIVILIAIIIVVIIIMIIIIMIIIITIIIMIHYRYHESTAAFQSSSASASRLNDWKMFCPTCALSVKGGGGQRA